MRADRSGPDEPRAEIAAGALAGARATVLGLGAFIVAITVVAIGFGWVVVGRGDPSVRLIGSFQASTDLSAFALSWTNWLDHWPAGHFLIQGAWVRLLEAIGIDGAGPLSQAVLLLSLLAWLVALVLLQLTVARAAGAAWGWLAALGYVTLSPLTELAHNAYGEAYLVPLYVACLHALLRFDGSRRARWLVLAAACLLVASTIRDEAIIAAAALSVVLFLRHGWRPATLFLTLSSAFTAARILSMPSLTQTHVRDEAVLDRILDVLNLGLYLLVPTAVILFTLAVAFRSRPRPLEGEPAREALLAYAGWSALALLAFYFGALLFLTSLGPDNRFLATPSVGIIIALACAGTRTPDLAWASLRRWCVPWTLAASTAAVFLLGIDFLTDAPRPPRGVREAYTWLRSNGAPGRAIAVDHIHWWQSTIVLYGARTPSDVLRSHVNLGSADAAPQGTSAPPPSLGPFLEDARPAFVVRSTDRPGGGGWGPAWTFLDAWSASGRARVVLQNEDATVYALEWLPGS